MSKTERKKERERKNVYFVRVLLFSRLEGRHWGVICLEMISEAIE